MGEKNFVFKGVLTFHSETGTEGGYWAFQDERFITKNTTHFSCKHCGLYWDKSKYSKKVILSRGEKFNARIDTGEITPTAFEKRFCERSAHDFQKTSEENWSYEGLHILKDGDHLTIYSKDDPAKIVWDGTIQLRQFDLFTEHASGMWIHAEQVRVDRQTWAKWFFDGYPAELSTLVAR